MAAAFPVKFDMQNYDINKFLRDHPGGVNTLKYYKGKCITQAMAKYAHSSAAYNMLKDFQVDDKLKDGNLTGNISVNGRIITKEETGRDVKEIQYLEELEARLDWSKPLLHQLGAVADDYDKWVNSAVYRKCRLFKNSLLERLTYTPWFIVPAFWIPVIISLGIWQFHHQVLLQDGDREQLTVLRFFSDIAVGFGIWTAMEYSLHRWLFHMNPGKNLYLIKFHFLLHGLHHKTPFDELRQVFPPFPAVVLALVAYGPLSLLLDHCLVKMVGGLAGYLAYDMIHYYVHHGSPKDGTYMYTMKRYHSNHHFVNHDQAFGISTKIWDYVFNTLVQVKKLNFSLHWHR